MKVLSLTEPYATLIKNRIKTIETRSWKTNYRGKLYIHASKTKIPKKYKDNNEKFEELILKIRYEQQKIIIRNICNYIAGMTDGFALEEYNRIK